MENTFVVNDEPITIKITIEVIPSKKKEDVKETTTVVKPPFVGGTPITILPQTGGQQSSSAPDGWNVIEPTQLVEPTVEPIAPPEKKKRAYTRKPKPTEEVVKEKVIETLDTPPIKIPVAEEVKKMEPVKPITATNPNKVVARLAQMINFFCKASNIEVSTVTKKYLVEHGASDIFENIEGITDEMIEQAIKQAGVIKKEVVKK